MKYPETILISEVNLIIKQDMRYRDVAKTLGVPLSTVNSHINTRLKKVHPDIYQKVHEIAQSHRHKQDKPNKDDFVV